MSGHTETQPRMYRPRVSLLWWARRRSYLLFALRELSSVFVAWFVAYLLLLVAAVASGAGGYERFLAWSASPWMIALNVVALAFVVLHTVTFFNLTPQAMVVRVGGRRVPGAWLIASQFVAWALVSALIVWLILG